MLFSPLTPQPLLLLHLSRAIHPTLPYYFPPFPPPHPSPLSHLFLMHTHPFLPIPVEIHYKLTTDATLHQLTQISQSATFTDNPHLSLLPPSLHPSFPSPPFPLPLLAPALTEWGSHEDERGLSASSPFSHLLPLQLQQGIPEEFFHSSECLAWWFTATVSVRRERWKRPTHDWLE